jgi:hypothetical protein
MAAFSIFVRTSKISRRNFDLLLRILRHRHFDISDLPKSYAHARRTFSNIPTLPLEVRQIHINKRKGSGRSRQETVKVYTHSVKDLLKRVLSVPSLFSRMYFGPGIKVHEPCEFWHGTLWMESCLFGALKVEINGRLEQWDSLSGLSFFLIFA